jgi:hypothetical protein
VASAGAGTSTASGTVEPGDSLMPRNRSDVIVCCLPRSWSESKKIELGAELAAPGRAAMALRFAPPAGLRSWAWIRPLRPVVPIRFEAALAEPPALATFESPSYSMLHGFFFAELVHWTRRECVLLLDNHHAVLLSRSRDDLNVVADRDSHSD